VIQQLAAHAKNTKPDRKTHRKTRGEERRKASKSKAVKDMLQACLSKTKTNTCCKQEQATLSRSINPSSTCITPHKACHREINHNYTITTRGNSDMSDGVK
jgi:hypothetical protein